MITAVNIRHLWIVISIGVLLLLASACTGESSQQAGAATATLLPVPSQTPRFTATPEPSLTPIPSNTPEPSETPIPPTPTLSPTPSATPQTFGIVSSTQRVNVREGPGTNFAAFAALPAGERVEVLETAETAEGTWYRVRLTDGREGWMASSVVRVEPSPTPLPTAVPTIDETAVALGTVYPTAVLGGNPVSPTPPPAVASATASAGGSVRLVTDTPAPTGSAQALLETTLSPLSAFELTATAIMRGAGFVTPTPGSFVNTVTAPTATPSVTPGSASTAQPGTRQPTGPTLTPPPTSASSRTYGNLQILAECNTAGARFRPPNDIGSGSTVFIWWEWFARTEQQVNDHISAATYEVRLNDLVLENWAQYVQPVQQQGDLYFASWVVPVGQLPAGTYQVSFRVTWSRQIDDGFDRFGPGTANTVLESGCTFTVNP